MPQFVAALQTIREWLGPAIDFSTRVGCRNQYQRDLSLSAEYAHRLRKNLGPIQQSIKRYGVRVIFWVDPYYKKYKEVRIVCVSLASIEPVKRSRSIFYHVTPKENLDSILEHGLRPHANREYIFNPIPAVYLAADIRDCMELAPTRNSKDVYLQVTVPLEFPLYVDPEAINLSLYGQSVYITRPIPPQWIELVQLGIRPQ